MLKRGWKKRREINVFLNRIREGGAREIEMTFMRFWAATRGPCQKRCCECGFLIPQFVTGLRTSPAEMFLQRVSLSSGKVDWRAVHRRFNSRARVGRDVQRQAASVHHHGFNSRARVGRDISDNSSEEGPESFNSRARVGRDDHPARTSRIRGSFNSRARVGRDAARRYAGARRPFQFTRPRGARQQSHKT